MTHDPLCPLNSECPGRDRPHFMVGDDIWCGGCQIECQCNLIDRARNDILIKARELIFHLICPGSDDGHCESCEQYREAIACIDSLRSEV